jgi:hypothetical protein
MFKSFIYAVFIRYVVTNSDEHWYDCMVRKFTHRLLQRGYPLQLIASIASQQACVRQTMCTADRAIPSSCLHVILGACLIN